MLTRVFMGRILRNLLIQRDHPFFAHFHVTARCNLKCRYCEVHKTEVPELDTAASLRVIDRLADMRIAVLSFSGGEPLLRDDMPRLIDRAKARELAVKITSNGTLHRRVYRALLGTDVDSINVSMDGVLEPGAAPHEKMDPRILDTLEYLYAHRGRKQLFVSALYHGDNAAQIRRMVVFLDRLLPGLEVFVQPVMSGGGGHFRSSQCGDVDPALLRELEAHANVANPRYYNDHCQEYLSSPEGMGWRCHAGRQFFDVKADGAFWVCQDRPTALNVLHPDFVAQWRALDTRALTDGCRGCTYSCYVIAQRAFELRNAPTWLHGSRRL